MACPGNRCVGNGSRTGGIWISRRTRARGPGPNSRFWGKITSCAAIPRPKMTKWPLFDSWDSARGTGNGIIPCESASTMCFRTSTASQDTPWGIYSRLGTKLEIPRCQIRPKSHLGTREHDRRHVVLREFPMVRVQFVALGGLSGCSGRDFRLFGESHPNSSRFVSQGFPKACFFVLTDHGVRHGVLRDDETGRWGRITHEETLVQDTRGSEH